MARGSQQGIEIPVSLQLQNLQEIANSLKKFAGENILGDSINGKKINAELQTVLKTLTQIETRAKNGFKIDSDFGGLDKEINRVELSLDKVYSTIGKLTFNDLKVPSDVQGKINELNAQIKQLRDNFNGVKEAQKIALVNNGQFALDLNKAFPSNSSKILGKTYDEIGEAIKAGTVKIQARLEEQQRILQQKQLLLSENKTGQANFAAQNVLDFLEKGFKELPKNPNTKLSDQQQILEQYMKIVTDEKGNREFAGFKSGASYNNFFNYLAKQYELTPEQLNEIKKRIRDQMTETKKTAAQVMKNMATDQELGAKIMVNTSRNQMVDEAAKYADQVKDTSATEATIQRLTEQGHAANAAWQAFQGTVSIVSAANEQLKGALQGPQTELEKLQQSVLENATAMPQLSQAQQEAAASLDQLRAAASAGEARLKQMNETVSKMDGVSNFINRYIGLYAIVRKVSTAIRNAFNNIKELDKTITSIAVVTNMSQKDLWGKIGEYTQMAQQYGVAVKGVYEVSQIFYQQGLQTSQVMSLTTETLKMAKIAGIDYSTAANAMTVAVRAFKIEMTDAQQVTDTYSALAAKFAVSSAEIANAMEKTASSAASVGMSLESTSAFISVMEQTTRESAQNIGSALKSIISRYGEMKASPSALLNVDGEEVAFNKVDTALKSIGISIKDAGGQFRDFDDVIMELAQKWNSLDNNTQRYIATIMAGNRQQSRFIALVSNYDELSRAMDTAANAENASIVQVAKTMDSLESKANQLQNAFSQLYLDLHIEDGLKGAYDWLTKILKTIGKLGVGKGLLPSLMNVVGLGIGTKKLIGMGKEAYQNRVKKVQVEVEDKNNKIQEIQNWIKQPEDKIIHLKMDDSQIQQASNTVNQTLAKTQVATFKTLQATNSNVSLSQFRDALTEAKKDNSLTDEAGREAFLNKFGITKDNTDAKNYQQLDTFLQTIGSLNTQAQTLGTTLQALGVATEGATQSEEQKTNANNNSATSELEKAQMAQQAANINYQAALDKWNAVQQEVLAGKQVSEADIQKAYEDYKAAQAALEARNADVEKIQPAHDAAAADRAKALAAGQTSMGGQGSGQMPQSFGQIPPRGVNQPKTSPWEGKEGLMKGIGVASSLARIAGTAITAAGAAHEDRSTDKYETSKILTGVGNGLSMAGTGASMGMAFGPWGAAIGAIGGFLVGGLGAIADGLEKTASEKLAQLKEKAQKASDDSLKTQAKAEDLSSRISNLKQLKKAMYDSNEDMQAYKDAMNNIASEYPNLISSYDAAGNAIIDLVSAEEFLIDARQRAAQETRKAAIANADAIQQQLEMTENFATAIEQELKTTGQSKKNEITGFGTSLTTTKNGWNVVDNNGQSFTIVGKKTLFDQFGSRMAATGYNYEEAIRETVAATIQDENFKFTDELTGEKTGILNSILDKEKTGNHQWTYDEVATWAWWLSQSTSGKAHNSFLATSDQNYFRYNPQGTNISYQVPHYTNLNTGATNDVYNALTDMGSFYDNMINYQNEMEFQGSIKTLDEFIETNKELLGTSASTAAEYFDWGEDGPTREDVRQALLEIQRMSEQLKITKQSLDTQASKANATEYFNNAVQNYDQPVMAGRKAQVIDNNLYSNLVYKNLELSAKEKGYTSGIEWSNSNKVDYQAAATSISEEISAIILKMSDSELDIFNSVMSDLTVFTDINSVFKKLGINETDRQTKFALGIIEQFKIDNEKNRDRLLGTIYNLDKNGRVPFVGGRNDAFKTLWRFNDKNGTELLKIIGSHFLTKEQGGAEDIITKYSDYFTTSIVSINKLAEDGYTELAYNRLQILSDFSTSLAQMSDQEQQDMFGILTQVDFSNYESIQTAKESLTKYTKEKGITIEGGKFEGLWNALENAENNLIFNITTLANTLTTQIESATKEMDSILSTNKSGLSFDKALEEFKTLSAKFSDLGSFDTVFSYDAVLGKYVYTQEGLQKAIQAREQNLQDTANRLAKETEIYTNKIIETTPEGHHSILGWDNWDSEEDTLQELEDYKDQIEDKSLIPYYENLIKGFWASSDYEEKNWYNYIDYVENIAQQNSKEAEAAQKILQEYQANKKNQYYQAIDWSKLALGTDISGTNRNLMVALAKESETYGKDYEDENGVITRILKDEIEETDLVWNEVLEDYLKNTYSDENMREIAKAAINGQISQQKSQSVSTAISELLNGAGSTISEETAALLYANSQFEGKLDSKGLLNTGLDYVQSALDLFEAEKSELTTAAERNASYKAIMDKKFSENNAAISFLASGASLDTSAVESFFTSLGKNIDEFYDVSTNTWFNGLGTVLSTDMFGKTRITDWEGFKQKLNLSEAFTQTYEYLNAYSSYVDGVIQNNAQLRDLIKKSYDNAFNQIDLFKEINVSQMSQEGIEVLTANGAATINDGILVVNSAIDYANNAINYFAELSRLSSKELYEQTGWTSADLAKNWKTAQTALTQAWDSWAAIGSNLNAITTDQISTLIEKGGLKIEDLTKVESVFTKVGDHYALSLEKYADYLLKSSRNISPEQYQNKLAEARQAIINNISELDWAKVLDGTATDVDLTTFTDSLRDNLASLSLDLNNYIHNGNLNITELTDALQDVDQALVNHIKETIAEIQNNILSSITSAATYGIEGTNDITNMQKFVDEYNKLTNQNISISGAFEYDTILDQFTLNNNILQKYIEAQKKQLEDLGMKGPAIEAYIKDQTQTILQQNMDITSILSDTDNRGRKQAGQALVNQLEKIAPMLIEEENKNFEETQKRWKNYPLILNNLTKIHEETLKEINSPVEQVQKLYNGGKEAVKILKRIKGEQISSEEIQTVYRAAMDRLNEASEQLTKGIGETVSGTAATILQAANYGLEELDDGTYVIKTIGDMVKAYNILYQTMAKTGTATTAELNSTYAKMLTAYDQPEIDAISTLNDAMGMTYEALGNMLANYGIQLKDVMKNANEWGLQSVGNGKVQIYDFDAFAKQMKWSPDSQEYLEARKAYNDSLIELDKQIGKNLTEEIKAITEAKAGDKINLTYLENLMGSNLLNELLKKYGTEVKNGIVEFGDNINITGLITDIANAASKANKLLPEELAELADAVSDYIDNIISLIKNGISGSLKNVDAQKLQSWAKQFNLDLDFTQTAEGLKLSQKSAIELYNALKGVDNIKAKLVFDELNKSLQETNEHYKSISDILNRIAWIEDQDHPERAKQYAEELALAKEILAVRSTSEDSSFNFMSNKIPGGQNNPINYFNNWSDAIQKLQTAMSTSSMTSKGKKTGLIDYQDWYNIVTEMNNLAAKTGPMILSDAYTLDGTLESAAALIEAGASALTVDSAGKVKVALGDIGIDFEAGAGEMSSGIETGIQEMARSQVDMLDGLIALLELIVQMEQLGDIDVDGMGISFEEIFDPKSASGFSKAYDDWREAMLNQLKLKKGDKGYNKDLQNALKGTMINGQSLASILELTPSGLRELDKSTQDAYAAVLDAFSKAAKSGNFDTDNIYESIKSVLAESGLGTELSITIGDTTLVISGGQITSIDWKDANTEKVLKQWEEEGRGKREDLIKKIEQYHSGEAIDTKDLTYVLKLERKLQIDDSGDVIVSINGKNKNLGKLDPKSVEFERAQNWIALLDQTGLNLPIKNGQEIDITKEPASITVSEKVNTNYTVSYDRTNGLKYSAYVNGGTLTGDSLEDLSQQMFKLDQNRSPINRKYKSVEEVQWLEFNIRAKVQAKVTIGENEISLASDPTTRENVKAALENPNWDELIPNGKVGADGNLTFTLGDATFTIPGAEVTMPDGKTVDTTKLEAYIRENFLGMDLGLQETIAEAIKKAFTEIPTEPAQAAADAATTATEAAKGAAEAAKKVGEEAEAAKTKVNELSGAITNIPKVTIDNTAALEAIAVIDEAATAPKTKTVYVQEVPANSGEHQATGNVGIARAQGTLMGELGPELYVQNGRYFVAGQNGPEFVDLAPDAIVFNHLQTRSLLDKGMSPGRGKAVTNERNAVSYAKGNVNGGPAMASASAALAALKQLRAQWQALAQLNTKDLAGAGGGGGGGGDKAFIKDLERWYNWLQRIAQLEKEINYEENLRSKIQSDAIKNGKAYYDSQKKTLENLKEQVAVTTSLMLSQSEYFDKRRAELNSDKNPFWSLYWFDEYGQLQYQNGKFEEFTKMVGTDKYNKPNMTPEEQYKYITQVLGIDKKYMQYDNSGNEIKGNDYNAMVQAFWDKIDTDQKEMQSLHDSIDEQKNAITSELQKQNELIQAMKDNQKEVEEAVLGAIVESRERQIKELQDTKDALQKSNQDFIDGLSKQLDKEQKMYQNSEKDQELQRNRRQLDILKRSGASASQIAQLQKEIDQQTQDEYFTKQQEQIDAVKEASDLQIERLDHQIELEQEELEYQKANGLLWEQVYEVMAKTPEEISAFIQENTAAEWAKSPLSSTEAANNWIFKTEQWASFRDDIGGIYDALNAAWEMFDASMKDKLGEDWDNLDIDTKKALQTQFNKVYAETGDYNKAAKAIQGTDVYQSLKKKQNEEIVQTSEQPSIQTEEKPKEKQAQYRVKYDIYDEKGFKTNWSGSGTGYTPEQAKNVAKRFAEAKTNGSKYYSIAYYKPEKLYKEGGLIDYTGPAWVDGTPQKPESIWDAETTKLMRDNLLNPRSLNLLGTFWDTLQGYQTATNHSYSNNSESIVIENATVEMNVASIANDYDARRAGEQAMEEMLKIARKTKVSSF